LKQIHTLLAVLVIILTVSCKPSFTISEVNYQEHNFQVATADNNYTLDMQQVYEALVKSKILNLGGVLDTVFVRDYIDSLVLDSLIGFDARKIKLDEHYAQYRMFKLRYYDILLRQCLKKMVYDKAVSDSAEIVAYYYANEDLFAIEEQVNLYDLALTNNTLLNGPDSLYYREMSDEELENQMVRFADSIKSLITSPDKFPEIAKQFSEDVAAARDGGHIGWTKRNKYVPPFDSVAFALRAGDIGGPYKDVNGWHIIMVDEYFPAGLPELNENLMVAVEKTLQTSKTNTIGNKLIDSLFSKMSVQLNMEIADKDIYVVDGKTWGAIINGLDTIDCNEARSLELTFRDKYKVQNTTAEMKASLFRQLGERYAIVQAARHIGLEEDSVVTVQREKLMYKYARAISDAKRKNVKWVPSDSLLQAYYDSHMEDFEVKKPLKVQHIIVSDSVFGEFLRDQAMSGIDFMELAKEHYPGEESIRSDLADLGYIGKKDVSEAFYNAAAITLVGDISHPVKTEFGYHLIKVLEHKSSQTFDEARRTIAPILKKEYQLKFTKEFKHKLFDEYNVHSLGSLYPVHLKPKSMRQ